MPSNTNQIYGPMAASYGTDVAAGTAYRLKHDLAVDRLTGSEVVLDVGCASGIHLGGLADRASLVVGVDTSHAMLLAAHSQCAGPKIAVAANDACALSFADATFDVVVSFSTLVLVDDLAEAVAEISRVLEPGGTAIVDLTGRWNPTQLYWRRWFRRRGHRSFNPVSQVEAAAVLTAAGLIPESWFASGITDLWRYLPRVRHSRRLDRFFHGDEAWDLDHRISNRRALQPFASRWLIVATKR